LENITLEELGWHGFFAELCHGTEFSVGRVVLVHKYLYRVVNEQGEWIAEPTGKFIFETLTKKDYPAVGDWILMTTYPEEGKAMIHQVLERKSVFIRQAAGFKTELQVLAANIDFVFLVNALNDDFNIRRLERYLLLAYESRATPVIILTKRDLCDDLEEKLKLVDSVTFGAVPVIAVDNLTGVGLVEVRGLISRGKTIALLGSSGVGKSTLLNALIGEDVQEVSDIREDDSKGRHTTTHRELFILPGGGLVIDTPGMRELRVSGGSGSMDTTFADIEELISGCRFSDCRHRSEPGCKVKEALADGSLDYDRYRSYQKLQRELAYQEKRQRENLLLAKRRGGKRKKS